MTSILIAYDGSAAADRTLRQAAAVHRPGDVVDVLALEAVDGTTRDDAAPLDERLTRARGFLSAQGITAAELWHAGDPFDALLTAAEHGQYDLVLAPSGLREATGSPAWAAAELVAG